MSRFDDQLGEVEMKDKVAEELVVNRMAYLLVLFAMVMTLPLFAPSPSALRIMIHCCNDFAGCRGLRFNASKTQLIHFSHSQIL